MSGGVCTSGVRAPLRPLLFNFLFHFSLSLPQLLCGVKESSVLKCLYHLLGNGTLSLDLIVSLLVQVHTSTKAWKGTRCSTDHSFLSRVRRERRGQLPQHRSGQQSHPQALLGGSPVEAGQRSASGDTSEHTSECNTVHSKGDITLL